MTKIMQGDYKSTTKADFYSCKLPQLSLTCIEPLKIISKGQHRNRLEQLRIDSENKILYDQLTRSQTSYSATKSLENHRIHRLKVRTMGRFPYTLDKPMKPIVSEKFDFEREAMTAM